MDSARDFAQLWNLFQGSGCLFVRYGDDRGTQRVKFNVPAFGLSS